MQVYIYVLVMAPTMTNVSGIKFGSTNLALIARVIHLWSVPDRTNPAEEGSLHMLLLDEKVFGSCLCYSCLLVLILNISLIICILPCVSKDYDDQMID